MQNIGTLKQRIKNGDLQSYRYRDIGNGKRRLLLTFWGDSTADTVIDQRAQKELLPLLAVFDAQRSAKLPERYADCNGYVAQIGSCKILKEMLCVTRGRCSFYKAKDEDIGCM